MESAQAVIKKLVPVGIVPVVVIDDARDAVPTAKALLQGGVCAMEITFRTEAAADAIHAVAKSIPDMLVGAGTVLNAAQCKSALESGANFIVSPGCDEELIRFCMENDTAIIPGCVTPTEIMAALKHGLTTLKFFPANVYGGLAGMKALSAPFNSVQFLPTGGVNAQNLAEYISAPFVCAVGGSWICARRDIADGNFEKITNLSAEAVSIIQACRRN